MTPRRPSSEAAGSRSLPGFFVVLPVKRLDRAKTRLHADPEIRRTLAHAFFRDTLDTLIGCPAVYRVVLVSADRRVLAEGAGPRCVALAEEEVVDAESGLNSAIRQGVGQVAASGGEHPAAVLPADVPALPPQELAEILAAAGGHPLSHVVDRTGAGTTLLAARRAQAILPQYGPGSAYRHRRLGGIPLDPPSERIRMDVDTLDDLAVACSLGLGRHTRAALEQLAAAGHEEFSPARLRRQPDTVTAPAAG